MVAHSNERALNILIGVYALLRSLSETKRQTEREETEETRGEE
jgi:hypothetical protein